MDAKELALLAAGAAEDGRAEDVLVLDLQELTTVSNYFVLCSGQNYLQVRAIADHVRRALREAGRRPGHIEGYNAGRWVLLDYDDLVVHVFHHEEREYYGLERLWGDAVVIQSPPVPSDRP